MWFLSFKKTQWQVGYKIGQNCSRQEGGVKDFDSGMVPTLMVLPMWSFKWGGGLPFFQIKKGNKGRSISIELRQTQFADQNEHQNYQPCWECSICLFLTKCQILCVHHLPQLQGKSQFPVFLEQEYLLKMAELHIQYHKELRTPVSLSARLMSKMI